MFTLSRPEDESRNINPVQATKAYDIPFHLREPTTKEFREMLRSGVLTQNEEATEWCSQSFPVQKPGSDRVRCRWFTLPASMLYLAITRYASILHVKNC